MYTIIAKYDGVYVKVDRLEINDDGTINAVWFMNKKAQHQWAFPKNMEEFIIKKEIIK